MSLQRTLSIIKPDAVKRHLIGAILARFEQQGFKVIAAKWYILLKSKQKVFMRNTKASPFLRLWWNT